MGWESGGSLDVVAHAAVDQQDVVADEPDEVREVRRRRLVADVLQHRRLVNCKVDERRGQMGTTTPRSASAEVNGYNDPEVGECRGHWVQRPSRRSDIKPD